MFTNQDVHQFTMNLGHVPSRVTKPDLEGLVSSSCHVCRYCCYVVVWGRKAITNTTMRKRGWKRERERERERERGGGLLLLLNRLKPK